MSRATAMLVALAAVLAACLVSDRAEAGTSSAGSFVYVSGKSTADATSAGSQVLNCPSNTRAVGAGGSITGGLSAWLERAQPMDSIFGPDGDPDNGGVTQSWNSSPVTQTMRSSLICMKGSAAEQLAYAKESMSMPAGSGEVGDTLACTGHLVGGGAGVDPDPSLSLESSVPRGQLDGTFAWMFYAKSSAATSGKTLSAVAACLPEGVRHIRSVYRSVRVQGYKTGSVVAHCPDDFHVAAGGGSLSRLMRSVPIDGPDADHVPDDGWAVTGYNGVPVQSQFGVVAMCVR